MRLQYLKTPENSCVSDAVFPLLVHFSVFGLARTGPFWVYPELICMRSVFSSIFWYLICHRWFQFLMLIPNNWGRFSFWRINQKWWYLRNLYYECIQYFLMMVWPPPLTPFFWKKHGKRGLRNRHSRQVKGWRVKTTRKSCTSWHVKRDEPCGSIHITSWKQQLWFDARFECKSGFIGYVEPYFGCYRGARGRSQIEWSRLLANLRFVPKIPSRKHIISDRKSVV